MSISLKKQKLRRRIEERREETVEVLRDWITAESIEKGDLVIDIDGIRIETTEIDTIIDIDNWVKVISHGKAMDFVENIRDLLNLERKLIYPDNIKAVQMDEIEVSGDKNGVRLTDPNTGASKELNYVKSVAMARNVERMVIEAVGV